MSCIIVTSIGLLFAHKDCNRIILCLKYFLHRRINFPMHGGITRQKIDRVNGIGSKARCTKKRDSRLQQETFFIPPRINLVDVYWKNRKNILPCYLSSSFLLVVCNIQSNILLRHMLSVSLIRFNLDETITDSRKQTF